MDSIVGPIEGQYITAHTVQMAAGHFGYAKISQAKPACVWDDAPTAMWMKAGPFLEAVTALVIIIDMATNAMNAGTFHDRVEPITAATDGPETPQFKAVRG